MNVKAGRWLLLFGAGAVLFTLLGIGASFAQQVLVIPVAEEQHPDNVGRYAPLDWNPALGDHPGKALFNNTCRACHTLSAAGVAGPGLRGLEARVPSRRRLFEFIVDPKATDEDEYFAGLRRQWNDAMQPRGGNPNLSDEDILHIIDYILRHDDVDFNELEYRRQVRLGRLLVSGARSFRYGVPSCTGCHSIGADDDLMGAGVAGNASHTGVLAARLGNDRDHYYMDGLREFLQDENGPAMHHHYRGARGLTDLELQAVATFFDDQLRRVGTERESNYLPILALIVAALGILLIEPGLYARMFVKEDKEYVDGPYEEEGHH
jgi:cytochrome c5